MKLKSLGDIDLNQLILLILNKHIFLKMRQPRHRIIYFHSFQQRILQKNCRLWRDSNLDCWNRR